MAAVAMREPDGRAGPLLRVGFPLRPQLREIDGDLRPDTVSLAGR
jgi:hypothetical protein